MKLGNTPSSPPLTIPEPAQTLTRAIVRRSNSAFWKGGVLKKWRTTWLLFNPPTLTANNSYLLPNVALPSTPDHFLASLPATASLEGFLFPDTYRIPTDADTAYLLNLMLTNFGERVTPTMRQSFLGWKG